MSIVRQEIGDGLVKTFSDTGMKVERGGVRYDEAVDPAAMCRQYIETDEPIDKGAIMRYSTLAIKRELANLDRWEDAKELMQTAGAWDDFILANFISANDRVFAAMCNLLVTQRIVTQSQLDALLPKCEWSAD